MSTRFTHGENPLRSDKLNTALDEAVAKAGDTMTGPLILSGAPIDVRGAATKSYVDTAIGNIRVSGRLTTVLGPVGIPAGTTAEVDLLTYTLPAGTFATNGQLLRISVSGTVGQQLATRNPRLYFGSTIIGSFQAGTTAQVDLMHAEAFVWRMGPNSQWATGFMTYGQNFNGTVVNVLTGGACTENLSGPVIIKLTGQTNVAQLDSLVGQAMTIELV